MRAWGLPLALLLMTAAIGTAMAVSYRAATPNRFTIRNSAGAPLSNIRLVLNSTTGGTVIARDIPRLAPGEWVTFRHGLNDSSATIWFVLEGAPHTYRAWYVDLWRGEGWLFDIRPGGHVRSWYDYPGPENESFDMNKP